jgi:3-dehydroquinate dehydratase type I
MTLICVPLINETIEGMFNTGVRCKTMGADLLEFRLDFLKEPINDSLLTELLHLSKQIGLPGIITNRPNWEGGKFDGAEESRLSIMQKCISMGFDYVDLELNINNEKLVQLITKARDNQVKTIVSYHNFQNTPEQAEILEKLKQCSTAGGEPAKVAVNCKNYRDGLNVLKAGAAANKLNLSFSVMGMGEFGSVTRILSPAIGCKIVYASSGEDSKVVDGQVELGTLKELWDILGYH